MFDSEQIKNKIPRVGERTYQGLLDEAGFCNGRAPLDDSLVAELSDAVLAAAPPPRR